MQEKKDSREGDLRRESYIEKEEKEGK